MSATGYIQAAAFESYARLPLEHVAITVTATDGTALALRLTDRNGRIAPIAVPVPEKSLSQAPEDQQRPYAIVNLYAHKRGYEQIENENLQVFADTTTFQNLAMIPLSELPGSWDQTVVFDTPPQNL